MNTKIQNIINYQSSIHVINTNLQIFPIKQKNLITRIIFYIQCFFSRNVSINPQKVANEIHSLLSKENLKDLTANELGSLNLALADLKHHNSPTDAIINIYDQVINTVSRENPQYDDRNIEVMYLFEDSDDENSFARLTHPRIKIEK